MSVFTYELKKIMLFQKGLLYTLLLREKLEDMGITVQWWVTILVGLAIIAIIVALIVVAKFTRMARMK